MKLKLFIVLFFFASILQSCTKELCTETYDGITYTPMYKPMSDLRNIVIETGKPIRSNGKIFIKGNFIFLNETNKGFHIIDNTNPTLPVNIAFVKVPGNLDIIGKGNFLFIDNYVDLLTFDITNPRNIQLVNRKENALPFRIYNYGFTDNGVNGIIVDFEKKKERKENKCGMNFLRIDNWLFLSLSSNAAAPSTSNVGGANGQTGSLSRFALLNNYLYIANRYNLTPIDITNPLQPNVKNAINTFELETIYPFKNNLFLGGPNGMFIYGVSNPDIPNYVGGYSHWRGCDPVVVDNDIAYVTVRGNGPCGGNLNVLDVINVSNLSQPILLKRYEMQNPFGLGIYNNKLGICDGTAGFKLYNANDYNNLQLISNISSIKAFDVIMNNQIAILIAKDGLYQYNISNNPQLISKIPISN